jgi:uncharacterized protein (TIGR02453 family)
LSTGFPGFPREALEFFRGLERHNNRDWFQARKAIYDEKVKAPMRDFVERLNGALRTFAPEFISDPDKAIYRIYRDTRFSADKTPYKLHIAASFQGSRMQARGTGGFYVAISHKEVAVGGGVYMPDPAMLLAIRTRIAERHQDLRKVLRSATVRKLLGEIQGEQLTRVPKGFATDHPAADLLKYKRFILYVELPPELAATPSLQPEVVKRFRTMTPFLRFLTDALHPLKEKKRQPQALDCF